MKIKKIKAGHYELETGNPKEGIVTLKRDEELPTDQQWVAFDDEGDAFDDFATLKDAKRWLTPNHN